MNNGYWYLLFKRVEYFARRFIKKIKNSGFDYIGLYWEDESDNQISKLVTICRDIGLKIEAMHGPMIKKSAELGIEKFILHPCGKEVTSFSKIG